MYEREKRKWRNNEREKGIKRGSKNNEYDRDTNRARDKMHEILKIIRTK